MSWAGASTGKGARGLVGLGLGFGKGRDAARRWWELRFEMHITFLATFLATGGRRSGWTTIAAGGIACRLNHDTCAPPLALPVSIYMPPLQEWILKCILLFIVSCTFLPTSQWCIIIQSVTQPAKMLYTKWLYVQWLPFEWTIHVQLTYQLIEAFFSPFFESKIREYF